jgi:hypothetical protein
MAYILIKLKGNLELFFFEVKYMQKKSTTWSAFNKKIILLTF